MLTQKHFDRLFSHSKELACLISAEGSFKAVNPAWIQQTHWSSSELLNHPVDHFLNEIDQRLFQATLKEIIAGGEIEPLRLRFRTAQQHTLDFKWTFMYEPESNQLLAIVTDISELLTYREQLNQSAALTNAINTIQSLFINGDSESLLPLTLAENMMALTNADTVFVADCLNISEFNQKNHFQWQAWLSNSSCETLPQRYNQSDLSKEPSTISLLRKLLSECGDLSDVRTLHKSDLEALNHRQALKLKSLQQVSIIPLALGDQLLGLIGLGWTEATDVHPCLEKIQPFLQACAGILNQSHQQRWKKQASEKLKIAMKEAKGGIVAKNQFLATMSHEIRTPLNGLLGMTDLLSESSLTPEQRDYVNAIKSSGESLLVLLNDILDYSKLDANRVILEEISVDIRELVESIFSVYSSKAQKQGIQYLLEIEQKVPERILLDPTRLRQILSNLIDNAIKFTTTGSVIVRVNRLTTTELQTGERQEKALRFVVEDSGIGIKNSHIERLFEPFTQADSSMTRRFGGTGLGLAICKRLINLMGGEIGVDTVLGKGTQFHFNLPAKASVPVNLDSYRIVPNGSKTMVVIADEPKVAQIFHHWFENWGYQVKSYPHIQDWQNATGSVQDDTAQGIFVTQSRLLTTEEYEALQEQTNSVIISAFDQEVEGHPTTPHIHWILNCNSPAQLRRLLTRLEKGETITSTSEKQDVQIDPQLAEKIPIKILVVEDNRMNQALIKALLGKLGYKEFELAENGKEAVEKVKACPYDLILMDIQMPEMDGYEATRQIIASKDIPQKPAIVALTAGALTEDEEKCYAAGMNAYLTKPIRIPNLMSVITQFGSFVN